MRRLDPWATLAPLATPAPQRHDDAACQQPPVVTGGDVLDRLSSREIDALIGPLLNRHVLSADLTWRVVNNKMPAALASSLVKERLKERGWIMLPVHAHEWLSRRICKRIL